jgi:nucleoside-diphosphate kinase
MIERTLVLLKPDAVQRALIGELISKFEKTGFKVIGLKMIWADEKTAGEHYADDEEWMKSLGEKTKASYEKKGNPLKETAVEVGRRVRGLLMKFISMSPCVAICIEGHGAIEKVRTLVGATAPLLAIPGTIRGDYSFDSYELSDYSGRPLQNLIHASDSRKSAEKEIKIWFKEEELYSYKRVDEDLLYRKNE